MGIFIILLSSVAAALPMEGFEVFGLQKSTKSQIVAQLSYINPTWMSDFEQLDIYASHNLGVNYLTWGVSGTVGNRLGDRDAYFIRYDQLIWGQSLALKLAHRDESYLGSGKNIISFSYNGSFNVTDATQVYVSAGMNQRFNLNRWNSATWNPINFNTEDKEFYFEAVLGIKKTFGSSTVFSLDINNRDAFNSYNLDFTALDVALGLPLNNTTTLRLISSTRFSGFWVGTADIGAQSFLVGIVSDI